MFSILLVIHLGVELLGQMVIFWLAFRGISCIPECVHNFKYLKELKITQKILKMCSENLERKSHATYPYKRDNACFIEV